MDEKKLILVVDDEEDIRLLISYNLKSAGYEVLEAATGADAIMLIREKRPNLVLLDLMLGDISGLDISRIIKADSEVKRIPIIMITARTQERDIVKGLDLGADDYITKPFSIPILLSRVRSVLRRYEVNASSLQEKDKDKSVLCSGEVRLDIERHEVKIKEKEVDFSATEFKILEVLIRNKGAVLSRGKIIELTKGEDYPVTERAIDVQVLSIRNKLKDAGADSLIETIRGVGYRVKDK